MNTTTILPNFQETVILASASPRRKLLLELIGLNPLVIAPSLDEIWEPAMSPAKGVMHFAELKAQEVAKSNQGIIIAADTIVFHNNEVLNKPHDDDEARTMLKRLANDWHTVYTGIAVLVNTNEQTHLRTDYETSQVHFRSIDNELLDRYLATREHADKAGAYGIQGYGAILVTEIKGCYFNIMGLPLAKLYDNIMALSSFLTMRTEKR